MTTENMTLTDLKTAAKRRGYIVKKLDGEIEIYPKGKRGDASYFAADTEDAYQTMKADFASRQTERIKDVTRKFDIDPLAEEALLKYAVASGCCDWTARLFADWYRAGSTTVDTDTYSTLHRLRNHRDGYEILRRISESE